MNRRPKGPAAPSSAGWGVTFTSNSPRAVIVVSALTGPLQNAEGDPPCGLPTPQARDATDQENPDAPLLDVRSHRRVRRRHRPGLWGDRTTVVAGSL